MILREIAHSRSGDKGNTANISVIAYRPADYPLLVRSLTAERVAEHFRGIVMGPVVRYEIPSLAALNFVLSDALAGGVVGSLGLDAHGKSLGSAILSMEVDEPEEKTGEFS